MGVGHLSVGMSVALPGAGARVCKQLLTRSHCWTQEHKHSDANGFISSAANCCKLQYFRKLQAWQVLCCPIDFFLFFSVIMHQKWHSGVGFVGCFSGLAVATCGLIYLHQDLRYMAAETLTWIVIYCSLESTLMGPGSHPFVSWNLKCTPPVLVEVSPKAIFTFQAVLAVGKTDVSLCESRARAVLIVISKPEALMVRGRWLQK